MQMTGLVSQAVQEAGVPQSWIPALVELSSRESSWRPAAKNPNSSAYGLFQFLDGTWDSYAEPGWNRGDPLDQTLAAIKYVQKRYGTPQKALAFWDENNWY